MWERGLKPWWDCSAESQRESLPMWERGLKQGERLSLVRRRGVAPHVGAWIETPSTMIQSLMGKSLPMWERGLKLPL